jgi:intracellular septation protein A
MSAITADQTLAPERRFKLVHLAVVFRPMLLDFISTIAFAGLYALTGNLWISTGVGVLAGVGQVAWRLATRRPVAALQWAGLGLVITTASIAVATHSPLLVMIKPTLIYAVIGAAMLQPGWMLRYAPRFERSPIPPSAFVKAGYFVAGVMLLSAILNLYLALSTDARTWAAFIAIYPMASKLASFGLVGAYFQLVAGRNKRRGVFFPATSIAA